MTAERKPGKWVTGDAEDFLNDEGRPMAERKPEQRCAGCFHDYGAHYGDNEACQIVEYDYIGPQEVPNPCPCWQYVAPLPTESETEREDIRDSRIANEHGHDNSHGHVSAPSETPSPLKHAMTEVGECPSWCEACRAELREERRASETPPPEVGDESEWVHSEMCPTCDNSIEGRADDNESIWCPVCKKIVYPPSSLYAPRSRHVRLVRSSPLRPDYILKDGETFERDVLPIRCRAKYQQHIGTIRRVAREHGYAIGVHGSIRRDIDLIAAPWTEEASEPRVLAEAIEKAVDGVIDRCCAVSGPKPGDRGEPVVKPHGRLCWSIHLGGGPYIDLSVMPIAAAKEQSK